MSSRCRLARRSTTHIQRVSVWKSSAIISWTSSFLGGWPRVRKDGGKVDGVKTEAWLGRGNLLQYGKTKKTPLPLSLASSLVLPNLNRIKVCLSQACIRRSCKTLLLYAPVLWRKSCSLAIPYPPCSQNGTLQLAPPGEVRRPDLESTIRCQHKA